jgi:hypothetical protein
VHLLDVWRPSQIIWILHDRDQGGTSGGEDDFASREATIIGIWADHDDVIQVQPDLGSIRGVALDPSGHGVSPDRLRLIAIWATYPTGRRSGDILLTVFAA